MTFLTIIALLAAIAGVYAVLCAAIFLAQGSLLYHPERHLDAYPGDIGLAFDRFTVEASDGERIYGWFVPADGAQATILFCHGNAGNISHRLETLRILHGLGLNVCIFDYRGYGQSTGAPTEKGTYLDARAVWNYLTESRDIPADQIVLFGRSLGGAIAVELASEVHPAALILESTFTSILDMGAELYPFLPVRLASRFEYPTIGHLRRTQCPVLVVHSRDDRLVPFHHARALLEAAPGEKRFLEIRGGHNDGFLQSEADYAPGLAAFRDLVFGKE